MEEDPKNAEWSRYVRLFIATGETSYLDLARKTCVHETIRSLLDRFVRERGAVSPAQIALVAANLLNEGQETEAAVVQLLGLRRIVLQGDRTEGLDDEAIQALGEMSNMAVSLSREHRFSECEAWLTGVIGTRAVNAGKWDEAISLLERSAELCRDLVQHEPDIYRPHLAATLHNLSGALRMAQRQSEAHSLLPECVAVYRELAREDPGQYEQHLCLALWNHAHVLRDGGAITAASDSLREVTVILARLAEVNPGIRRPELGYALMEYARLLVDGHNLAEAVLIYRQAVTTFEGLIDAEPEVYKKPLAESLSGLGYAMQEAGKVRQALTSWEQAVPICRDLARQDVVRHGPDLAQVLNFIGNARKARKELSVARVAFEESAELCRRLHKFDPDRHRSMLANALVNLAVAVSAEQDVAQGCTLLEEAIRLHRQILSDDPGADPRPLATALSNFGGILRERGNLDHAARVLTEAVNLCKAKSEAETTCDATDYVAALTNFGAVLGKQGQYEEAVSTLSDALAISRKLAQTRPDAFAEYFLPGVKNLGHVLTTLRRFSDAADIYEEAVSVLRRLAAAEPELYRGDLGTTLCDLAVVLRHERRFEDAAALNDEALALLRESARCQPKVYRPNLALALNNIGDVLREQQELEEAVVVGTESVAIYRELATETPESYESELARSLHNLGTTLSATSRYAEACELLYDAAKVFRDLSRKCAPAYAFELAMTLNNLGCNLREEQRIREAVAAFEEASDTCEKFVEHSPAAYTPYLALCLSNLSNILEETGEEEKATDVATRAVEAAEGHAVIDDQRWLSKGMAPGAYRRLLGMYASRGDMDRAFRCSAALCEGRVRMMGGGYNESLGECVEALKAVEQRVGRPICVLVTHQAQTEESWVLCLLQSKHPNFVVESADSFVPVALELFDQVLSVFDVNSDVDWRDRNRNILNLGREAWQALPRVVRRVLVPTAGQDILVGGDPGWLGFPWEALRFGDGDEDLLGTHRPLVRWTGLTASAFAALRCGAVREERPTMAVVCPWDAESRAPLSRAKQEAAAVARLMTAAGFDLVPEGKPCLGMAANHPAIVQILQNAPAIFHFSGHGAVLGNEEKLLVCAEADQVGPAYFARRDLEVLTRNVAESDNFCAAGGMVVLNSCFTGRARTFGGQREDMAAAFLSAGAHAVICSARPVFEDMGSVFGILLFAALLDDPMSLAIPFTRVRAVIEGVCRNTRAWPAWSLLTYHGNPYGQLPQPRKDRAETIVSDVREEVETQLELVAGWLDVSAADLRAMCDRIKKRIQ